MRPLRFLLLLAFFIVLPLFLTCLSLVSSARAASEPLSTGVQPRHSRFRALFSFTTPSSLFPPSAVISLTNDNSTFFLARPAAFGPNLPAQGLNGRLWVGKGFGEELSFSEESLHARGFELGCSDVPGWTEEHRIKNEKKGGKAEYLDQIPAGQSKSKFETKSMPHKRNEIAANEELATTPSEDGTDDHLHRPLPDSNPAPHAHFGEPADHHHRHKGKQRTHADIESLQESADIAGKIVMLSRGGCGFLEKVKWAQRRGGVAVIVGDNQPGGPLTIMYAKGDTSNVTIPAIFTSYNAAHLLSSLVPPEEDSEDNGIDTVQGKPSIPNHSQQGKVIIDKGKPTGTGGKAPKAKQTKTIETQDPNHGWVQDVLSAVGMSDADVDADDSRRPPSSGNIDWVLLEDWDEDKPTTTSTSVAVQTKSATKSVTSTTKLTKAQTTTSRKTGNDDFVIGVQDWRDTELIAPKATDIAKSSKHNIKETKTQQKAQKTHSGQKLIPTGSKGGIITPGSGEYSHQKPDARSKPGKGASFPSGSEHNRDHRSPWDKLHSLFRYEDEKQILHPKPKDAAHQHAQKPNRGSGNKSLEKNPKELVGLWVTLTPTSVSASPFFDTLLVLVVSPLITLTVVYGMLLLRSRIRRRRWRAPKSIVDRLPVRTYQTMASVSSTTSSNVSSANHSNNTSPQLRPASSRPRPRSQTTTGIISSAPEKSSSKTKQPRMKRYTGRQIECVVCLEEYIDGESQVMSLPCGHEFHAECITPWLVTRRRTCPICKGDVVRSFSRSETTTDGSSSEEDTLRDDEQIGNEQTSDDIQDRAAEMVNDESSAAIPIPNRENDVPEEDVERGGSSRTPLLGNSRAQAMGWRGLLGASIGRLSGDTLWRSTSNERFV